MEERSVVMIGVVDGEAVVVLATDNSDANWRGAMKGARLATSPYGNSARGLSDRRPDFLYTRAGR